jgi:hypothetical protein
MNYRMGEVTNNHFPDKEEAEIELMFFLRHVDEGGIYAVMAPERAAASLHSFSSVF